MKKIIDIINLQETTQCYHLQVDLKLMTKKLIKYQKSLNIFKGRVHNNFQIMSQLNKGFYQMYQKQSKTRKSTSEIDYFVSAGVNVFGGVHTSLEKISSFYGRVQKRIAACQNTIGKYLEDLKKKQGKAREIFEKNIKQYTSECFPQTSSVMFVLGFMAPEKLKKKQNTVKASALLEEANRYLNFLNQELGQMESLKQEALEVSREYFEGARDFWIGNLQETINKLQVLEVNEDQFQKLAEESGKITDRSQNSNNRTEQEIEEIQ